MCYLYSHSETAHGKSLWIHQKEQKNFPWRFPNQVVGFSLGLSNHKSSLTNRVEEKSKSGNRSTCWAHFCGVALKLRQISLHVPHSIHVVSNMANFQGLQWVYFTCLCSKYPLVRFTLVRHSFVIAFFFSPTTLDQTVLNEMRRCTMVFYSTEIGSKIRQHHTLHIHFIQVCLEIKQSLYSSCHKLLHFLLVSCLDIQSHRSAKFPNPNHQRRAKKLDALAGNPLKCVVWLRPSANYDRLKSTTTSHRKKSVWDSIKPRPNDRNMPTHHIATLLGATYCVRLATMLRCVATCWVLLAQVWKCSNLGQQHPTRRNMSQQGGQTHATCCAQQCCDILSWHVAIVWPGLNGRLC